MTRHPLRCHITTYDITGPNAPKAGVAPPGRSRPTEQTSLTGQSNSEGPGAGRPGSAHGYGVRSKPRRPIGTRREWSLSAAKAAVESPVTADPAAITMESRATTSPRTIAPPRIRTTGATTTPVTTAPGATRINRDARSTPVMDPVTVSVSAVPMPLTSDTSALSNDATTGEPTCVLSGHVAGGAIASVPPLISDTPAYSTAVHHTKPGTVARANSANSCAPPAVACPGCHGHASGVTVSAVSVPPSVTLAAISSPRARRRS
jgi:hypothetical protein